MMMAPRQCIADDRPRTKPDSRSIRKRTSHHKSSAGRQSAAAANRGPRAPLSVARRQIRRRPVHALELARSLTCGLTCFS